MNYKTREEVPKEYKWDLESLIKDKKAFEIDCSNLLNEVEKLVSFKGKILIDSDTLLEFLKQEEVVMRLFEKIYVYSNMLNDAESTLDENQIIKLQADKMNDLIEEKLAFINPEILKSDWKKIKNLLEEKEELKQYRFSFELLFRYKEHTLSDTEEDLISKMSAILNSSHDIHYCLDNSDIHLGKIKIDSNEEVELTNSNYVDFMKNGNREIRKNTFNTMYEYFKGLKFTFATNFKNKVKENIFLSKIRKYNSPLEKSLYADNISKDVYLNLVKKTHENLDIMYKFYDIKKEVLNLSELHMYDIYVDISKKEKEIIPFETGKKIAFEALKPLGHQYLDDLKKAFDQRWIDVYPTTGKKSGAYSWGCYDSYPYVLLNYNDSIDSVSTLVHELGHSMHSFYSKDQIYEYHNYSIFIAEIASTVNEILLSEYLYNKADKKEEKIDLLVEILDKVRTTIYRQTMFAEFEMLIHDKEQTNISLTEKEISDTYYKLNELYYKNVFSDDNIRYEWARIPHFYSSFYVYKYATGLSCAIAIASRLINNDEEMKKSYLELLASGGNDYPLEILKKVNIDIENGNIIEEAFNYARKKVNELGNLIK